MSCGSDIIQLNLAEEFQYLYKVHPLIILYLERERANSGLRQSELRFKMAAGSVANLSQQTLKQRFLTRSLVICCVLFDNNYYYVNMVLGSTI